ncbi:putative aminoacyltransferase, E1 ubiquitin-activating enzyme [Medicago truncatula]|uniref:E3 ubiquitin protein ligase n=1 Tax=Medicago truncatula TaxID=3880 RepID=A0A072VK57_MEDTR|nr:E3 ubiquitin-protein ligase BRE1-like 2 [Medicago truncatula]KEH42364.1 E3 ubiquitin-protein ligase BRE1-like protein [Medicago truncatula]RHN79900.1 putative aminoacyltransferase, E1 ubiquitin-activating enzyme [Medicago truncatula]
MENSDHDEPNNKKPHLLTPVSSRVSPNSTNHSPNGKNADAGLLQLQNQQLVQQTETQKHALQDLEEKTRELKERQNSYDDILIAINQRWDQLVDDMAFLGIQAGRGKDSLETLDYLDNLQGSLPSCHPDDLLLCRLIQKDSIEGSSNDEITNYVEEALALRRLSTRELLKLIQDTVDDQMERIEDIGQVLQGDLSTEDVIIQISKIDDMTKKEADNFREVIDTLHAKHKEYTVGIQNYITECSQDQSDIKRLTGELDEIVAELEESRRKIVSLKMQKDAAMGMNSSNADSLNGNLSPEKPADRAMGLSELKHSIEEAKIVNADRLSELQDAREENQILTKKFQELQNELNDDKYVRNSRVYSLANDQLQHWIAELDRYKSLAESLQAGRVNVSKREKELKLKLESAVNARHIHDNSDSRIDELKLQLQKCIIEKNDLEITMEEAKQDTGRKDIKAEFRVMASALSKEMGMMDAQVKRWKDAALEAVSLREKAHSLREKLSGKTSELKSFANKCAEQVLEMKSSKALIEKLQEENRELEFVLDMYGLEDYQKSLPEVRESERKARSQAEILKNALDEHGLELRVRAANEAEAACEQRLAAAEAELEELRAQFDENERKNLEMTEAIKVKEAEAKTYISEIETIGQAYEDMQTQHQHLLQQVAERDDYNIKLVSESVKAKQLHSTLLSEKQALADQLQQINSLIENSKMKIANSEEQIKFILSEAAKCTQEEKHLAAALEFARWELADAEKELKLLKSVASASEKEYDQIQKDVEACEKELDSERSSRKKLEEELMQVNNQIAELNSEGRKTAVQQLEEEIRVCKNMIKCTVCSDRPKEVVIVKCYHLFCNPCIQRNLELRHRKCPACGTAFGQSDVRFVKI